MSGKLVVLLGFCLGQEIQASVLVSDAFSYPDGALVEVAKGKWNTHSGTPGQVQVAHGAVRLLETKTEDVSVAFGSGPVGATNAAAIYARLRFTFTSPPTGAYFIHFKDGSPTSGLRCRVFASTNGAAPGRFRLGIAAGASKPTDYLRQDLSLQTAYTLVCRMILSNNVSTLWINPKTEADPGVTSTDRPAVKSAGAFALRESRTGGAGMGELIVDDLIVATTFSEVARHPGFSVDIAHPASGFVQLHWTAEPSQSYSVWVADVALEDFIPLAGDLSFPDRSGTYEEAIAGGERFYRVCTP